MNSSLQSNSSIFNNYIKKFRYLNAKIFIIGYYSSFFNLTIKLILTIKDFIKIKIKDENTKIFLRKIYNELYIRSFLRHKNTSNDKLDAFQKRFPEYIYFINTNEKIKLINRLNYSLNNKIEITIIIAAYNNLDITLNCLLSVLVLQTKLKYEIILIDDHSSMVDYTTFGFKFRVIRNDMNFGFIKSNNLASKKARGKFLFFLNNDTLINK